MFAKIELKNFRKHTNFKVSAKERNVFVGANNAGKSSVLDALRLFADVERFSTSRLPKLATQENYGVCATYEMTNKNFSIPVENLPTDDTSDYAEIRIFHRNNSVLHIKLNYERQPIVFISSEFNPRVSKGYFKKCFPENVVIVPTLGQFEEREEPNGEPYVRAIENTRLAARNFRNIWRLKGDVDFKEFRLLVESNWPGIKIFKPTPRIGVKTYFEMNYEEGDVLREIYLSGFGFQIWLQIMTHFLRGGGNDILVLDEPDVYLHADLQRRLYYIARKRFAQIFIATHSSEIMNEANSGDVVLIRPNYQIGKRINTEDGYRMVHDILGSSENANFFRLSRAKRIVAFEGKDRSIYRRIEMIVRGDGIFSDPDTLVLRIGGFEQWPKVATLPWVFSELFGITPKISAIFDRDFRCLDEITEHENKLRSAGIFCCVLKRKEIENYLIDASVLVKTILKTAKSRAMSIEVKDIEASIEVVSRELKEAATYSVTGEAIKYYQRKKDPRDISEIVKDTIREFEVDFLDGGYANRVAGKEFLSNLNTLLKDKYNISVTWSLLLDEMLKQDFDTDLINIIERTNDYFFDLS